EKRYGLLRPPPNDLAELEEGVLPLHIDSAAQGEPYVTHRPSLRHRDFCFNIAPGVRFQRCRCQQLEGPAGALCCSLDLDVLEESLRGAGRLQDVWDRKLPECG